jgi:hypothetical protein
MAEGEDNGATDKNGATDGNSNPEATGAADRAGIDRNLPMVISPKLGSGEDEPVEETPAAEDEPAAAAAATPNANRFMMLAASVAFAAAFGSFVGSVSGSGLAHFLFLGGPVSQATPDGAATASAQAQTKIELAELNAIKIGLDNAVRNNASQFMKISERLDHLDQRSGANETTGSITTAAASETSKADAAKTSDRVLQDWVVHDVQNGRALVESRHGGIFDVGAGSVLPGLGRVDAIKRQDGQWVVSTARGSIVSSH